MRYLLILALALALTIVWQTSVVADNPPTYEARCSSSSALGSEVIASRAYQPSCE